MIKKKKHALLIYCEGQSDCDFVQHLKSIFCSTNKKIEVQSGQGGGPSVLISKAVRYKNSAEYKKKYIFLDADDRSKNEREQKAKKAEAKNIILIWSPICLENLLLQILNGHPQMSSSKEYKKYFNERYNRRDLNELFPKEKLNKKRDKISTLKQLIDIIS